MCVVELRGELRTYGRVNPTWRIIVIAGFRSTEGAAHLFLGDFLRSSLCMCDSPGNTTSSSVGRKLSLSTRA